MRDSETNGVYDRGISWVFSSGGTSVVFPTWYDWELREPLVWCQGSQVSMHVARGQTGLDTAS